MPVAVLSPATVGSGMGKLVRDLIPALIEAEGLRPRTSRVSGPELRRRLFEKLAEEALELERDPCAEELADCLEVLRAIATEHALSWDEAERLRLEKRERRGGFERGWVLEG